MCRMGKVCTVSAPCDIWHSCTAEIWQKVHRADLWSAKRRLSRAANRLSVGNSRARKIEASISGIRSRVVIGLGAEAVLDGEARLHIGARPYVRTLAGGDVGEVIRRWAASTGNTTLLPIGASALQKEARPHSRGIDRELKTGVVSQVSQAPALAGVYGPKNGGLAVTRRVHDQSPGS